MKKIFGKEKTSSAIFIYTILFFICSIFIALIFYRHSRSFIWGDGIHQHFLNLNFYRNFLINKVTLGDFNTFTWNIGMGMDLFSSLAYYIVGDFVSYFSIFFEQNKLELFFDIECFVRVFLIGISFIFYSKYKGRSNFASIVSAFIYSFCNFALFASFRHPYFSNALFLLPLLMMGIEKIINEDKKTFYIISIFLTFLSSFYFAYMLSICLLIYGSILIISKYRKDGLKKIIKVYFKVFVCTLVGIGLSSAILIPTLKQFFGSSRTLSNSNYMYTYKYYIHLLNSLVYYGGTNWVVIGINGIALVSLPLAFKYHKENKNMLLLLIILFIPLLLVDVGSIFCGFSFPNNRWSFVISFIISCLTGNILDKHLNFDKSDIKLVITFNFIYFVILFLLVYKLSRISIFAFIIATGVLLIIINKNMFKKLFRKIKIIDGFKFSLTMFILLTTLMNTYMFYVGEGYADKDFAKRNTIFDIYETNYYTIDNFDEAISKIKSSDKDFYRIGKNPFELSNVSLYYDYNSINYYLSIVPNPLGQLGYDLSSWTYYTSHEVGELNSRSKLLSLLGVKYFITDEPSYAPTTYQNLFNIDNTNVYKNSYNVNFGTFYDKYIDISKYEMMSSLEKEDSLLKVVALNEKDIDDKYVTKEQKIDELINKDISKIDFEISNSNNKLTIKNSKDNYLTLKIKNYPNKSGGGGRFISKDKQLTI